MRSVARYAIDCTPQMVFEPDLDTLSLWHFDEASGSTTVDASAGEPDATLSPTVIRVLSDR